MTPWLIVGGIAAVTILVLLAATAGWYLGNVARQGDYEHEDTET